MTYHRHMDTAMNNSIAAHTMQSPKGKLLGNGILRVSNYYGNRFLVQFRYGGHIPFQRTARTIEEARKTWTDARKTAEQLGFTY